MRIRRALAAAAVTAVIAPAALMAAPAAYATESESPDPTPTASVPSEDESAPADDTEPSEDASTPAEDTKPSEDASTPADDESASASPNPSTSEDEDKDEDEEEPAEECKPAKFEATLSGFPNQVVAGSGWHQFRLNIDNTDGEAQTINLGAGTFYKKDAHGDFESDLTSKYAEVQALTPNGWDGAEGGGYGNIYTTFNLEAGEKYSFKFRLRVAAEAPAGAAIGIAYGVYAVDGTCFADENWYQFEVLAAGTEVEDSEEPNDAKPQGGKNPIDTKPEGDVDTQMKGELAQTGSDSNLPMIALAGGVAVALGAGAMVVVRRRRTDANGTAAA